MEKGTKDGSVTKRKRKRETAKRVLDVLEDKAKQQIECSQQLEHTMKGIYYRLSSIQRILENDVWEKDMNAHYQQWLTDEYTNKRKRHHEASPTTGGAHGKLLSLPTTQLYHANVQTDTPNFPGLFPKYAPNRTAGDVPEAFGAVPFRPSAAEGQATGPLYLGHQLQEVFPAPAYGGRNEEPSPHESQSGATAPTQAAAADLQRPRTAPCMCEQREASAKRRLHSGHSGDRAGPRAAPPTEGPGSVATVVQKSTPPGEPQVFSDKELESAFDEEVIPDTTLEPNERLFHKEYPDLDKDFEPKRDYPLPCTPGQNYPGFEAQKFTDEELQNAFDAEEISDVDLRACERSFVMEFPSLAHVEPGGQPTTSTPSGAGPTKDKCPCGGAGVVRRTCPMKRGRPGSPQAGPTARGYQPVSSAVTVAEKRAGGGGEPQEFSDKDLENVFDEEVVPDVTLEPNERLFMTEYPELNKDFEPKRDYPLPYTPGQNYPGFEAQQFSPEELEKAFDAEEIPDVELQPNEAVFMLQFPSLAGDWSPGTLTAPSAASAAAGLPASSRQEIPCSERTCSCGNKIRNITCPKVRAKIGLPQQRTAGEMQAPTSSPQQITASAVTVAQKHTAKPGEPEVFDDKELENVFDEEVIPDVTLSPDERLFMKEYPELNQDFEPKRDYPLPFTPGQNYPGCEAQQFSPEELEKAFEAEEIPEVDLQPNERLFMLEFPSLAGDWTPGAAAALSAAPSVASSVQAPSAVASGRVDQAAPSAAGTPAPPPRIPGRRCCTCGKIIPGIVCPSTQPVPAPSPAYKSEPGGSAVTVAQKHTPGSGEPQVFDDKELENVFDEEPEPDVTLDPTERLFMKEYPDLDRDFEPKRAYPLPYTPGQNYSGKFCEAQSFSDQELEKAFDSEEIPETDLQPNERLFMMDFPAFAGDWNPASAAASVRTVPSSAKGMPPPAQGGMPPPPDYSQAPRCRNCGKRLARICPMKQALMDQQQSGGVQQAIAPCVPIVPIAPPAGY